MPRQYLLRALMLVGALLPGAAFAEIAVDMARKIDQVFAAYARPGSPGCALVLADAGRIVHARGYGLASIEYGVAIDPAKTVLDIASVSKQFTAASILLLAKDHRLSLDDSIRKHVPELPAYAEPVTLRHLLHHTGGVPDYIGLVWLGGLEFEDVITADYVQRALARQKQLVFPPGSEFGYSNSGYFLLSLVVDRVSGQPLKSFAKQRIFDPLGMTHTRMVDDHSEVVPNLASSYHRGEDGKFHLAFSNIQLTGDGGVLTTAEDLAKWSSNFDQPGVGGPWLVEQLQTRGRLNDGTPMKYARGMRIESYRGLPMAAHSGSSAGFNATLIRFPQQRVGAMALCNVGDADSDALLRAVADIYLAASLAPATASATETATVDVDRYTGTYMNLAKGVVHKVVARDGKLWYTGLMGEIELMPVGAGRFQMASAPLGTVTFSGARKASRRLLLRYDDVVLDMDAIVPVDPQPDTLRDYAGTYASDQLNTTWVVRVTDGQLTYQDARRPPMPLKALSADVFMAPFGLPIRFERDPSTGVSAFVVPAAASGQLRFVRTAAGR